MTLGLIDELADQATRLVAEGTYSTPEEATDALFYNYCTHGTCEPGLGGWASDIWNMLTGKPDSWYKNVSRIQNHLSVVLAGVTAVGSDAWAAALSRIPSTIDDYDTVTSSIQSALTSIIVTDSHVPDDGTIASADQIANNYDSSLSMVSAESAPDVQTQVQSDQQMVASELPGPMSSPSAVGQQEFVNQVEQRASALGKGIIDWTKYAAWGIGGLAALWALSKMGGR